MSIRSEIRGAVLFGRRGRLANLSLTPNQPLVLVREPANPVDKNAIILMTVLLEPVGYLAREDAARVAPDLDRGTAWFAKVLARPRVLLWKEPPTEKSRAAMRRRHREREDLIG